jgi:hypothetical protein
VTKRYRRASEAEYEACRILTDEGWQAYRIYGGCSPPDILAMGPPGWTVIMVRCSRRPVPDAHAVSLTYPDELDRMRTIGGAGNLRAEVWIRSPPDGWKRYRVYPGGLMRVFPGEAYTTPPDLDRQVRKVTPIGALITWAELYGPDYHEEEVREDRVDLPGAWIRAYFACDQVTPHA